MHKPTEDGIVMLIDGSTHNMPVVVVGGGDHTCILDFLYHLFLLSFFFFNTAFELVHLNTFSSK